jgi:hypothetical protein
MLGIYQKTASNRYEFSTTATGALILDTRTGEIYQPEIGGYINFKTRERVKDLQR